MFKNTVVASKLREQMADFLESVQGNDVLQVLHRGDSIKVMMTQTHYLDLMGRLAVYEKSIPSKSVAHPPASKIKSKLNAKLKQSF